MRHLRLLIYVIGILQSGLSLAQQAEPSSEYTGKPGMVIVEPTDVISTKIDGDYKLVPYLERRGRWGFTASVAYSSYEPINYEPDFVADEFASIYETTDMPMIE